MRPRGGSGCSFYGRVFTLLLFLLPPSFRRRFGTGMRQTLESSLLEVRSGRGRAGVFLSAVADLITAGFAEWVDGLRGISVSLLSGGLGQDVRFAVRSLRRRPLFGVVAITTLGLSIGAPSAMFSVVNGVFLRPLPYRDPGQLVEVWQVFPQWREMETLSEVWQNLGVSYPQFEDWKRNQIAFESVGIFYTGDGSQMTLTGNGPARRLAVGVASATLLPTLGVEPFLGRGFLPEEEAPGGEGSEQVALISQDFWRDHFGSDPDVLGMPLVLDGKSFQVVGVLPHGFRLRSMFKFSTLDLRGRQDVWVLPGAGPVTTSRSSNVYDAIARIRPGVSLETARADIQASLFQGADEARRTSRLVPRTEEELSGLRAPLLILLGATGLLLLIGCSNTATLTLSELTGRKQELTARWALGAGRWRVVRQLLTESALLGVLGSLVAILVAWAGTRALVALAPPIPRLHEIGVDLRVLAFTVGLGVLTGILFGTVPALFSTKGRASSLSARTSGRTDVSMGRIQRVLVGTQLALTVVLLVTAGLLGRSLFTLRSVDPGFRAEGLSTVRISIPEQLVQGGDPDGQPLNEEEERTRVKAARAVVVETLLDRLRELPGVTAVSAADALPFPGDRVSSSTVFITGRSGPASRVDPDRIRAWSGFHETMGVPVIAGRGFTEADLREGANVIVISESFARRYWPNRSPLGEHLDSSHDEPGTIVGVVGDVRVGDLSGHPKPTFYLPLAQWATADVNLLVRGTGAAGPLVARMRGAVHSLDPTIPVFEEGALPAMVAWSTREEEYRALLMAIFAGLATILAAVGIFGVTAKGVSHRSRELGIRIAVGAEHRRLVNDVVWGGLNAGLPGIAIGLVAAFWASQLVAGFLFGIGVVDPLTYGCVGILVAALCASAAFLPARRISRIDPALVLKEE